MKSKAQIKAKKAERRLIDEKAYPPFNGAAVEQTENSEQIARKIERYLNSCSLCLRVEEAEKLAAFPKMSLVDIIWTLQDSPNTHTEIITYFRQQFKINVETL